RPALYRPRVATASSTPALHDALPVSRFPHVRRPERQGLLVRTPVPRREDLPADLLARPPCRLGPGAPGPPSTAPGHRRGADEGRSEEHTSARQSRFERVCRLLPEKDK